MGIQGIARAYIHEITLYLPGGSIDIQAGFMQGLSVPGLLGMNGFFEHFIVKFDPTELALKLDRIHRA